MRYVARIAAIAPLFAMSNVALGCNSLQFSGPGVANYLGQGSGYEPFDPSDRTQAVTFTINKSGQPGCTFFVTAAPQANAPRQLAFGVNRLDYNVYLDAARTRIWQDLPTRTANDAFIGSFPAGNNVPGVTFTYFFHVPPQQVVRPSTGSFYAQTLNFRIYLQASGGTAVRTTQPPHRATVPAAVEVAFGGSGFSGTPGPQSMDFGALAPGQVQTLPMIVRGNNGFDVTLTSSNVRPAGGAMLPNPPTAADPSEVPYAITVGGVAANLAGAPPVVSTTSPTLLGGASQPIQVTIGNFGLVSPGNYKDVVNITVTSK